MDPRLEALALEQTWQRCPRCMHMISRQSGCSNMECVCGQAFCYACGSPRGTCNCHTLEAHMPLRLRSEHPPEETIGIGEVKRVPNRNQENIPPPRRESRHSHVPSASSAQAPVAIQNNSNQGGHALRGFPDGRLARQPLGAQQLPSDRQLSRPQTSERPRLPR
ncbi:hypothetical protein M426DRAFT_13151 [Hypoxylon sp. CI-4A]|nr:hypothetical protein M426DRAFT_13151 [Hypoxylon sp. CI-4A]